MKSKFTENTDYKQIRLGYILIHTYFTLLSFECNSLCRMTAVDIHQFLRLDFLHSVPKSPQPQFLKSRQGKTCGGGIKSLVQAHLLLF